MNNDNQIPIDFYYQEVFNSLIPSASATQKKETGIPLRVGEVDSMRRRFIFRISRENVTPEDCLKTLFSLALVRNSNLPIPEKKSDVKKRLIDKLTRDFLESGYFKFTDSEFQIRNQLNIDFPNFASLSNDALEGKRGKSDSSVQKVEGLFFETYDTALKGNSYFRKHPLSRKATVRKTQKNVRYKAPLGTKQKLVLAGLAIATAAQLSTIVLPQNTPTIEQSPIVESQEVVKNENEQSPEQLALQHIYSNPSSLTRLGIPPEISEQFSQYIKYRNSLDNGTELDEYHIEEYNNIRRFLVDSITTTSLDKAISNSFYTYPDSINTNALNGLTADVNFNIGENNYNFTIQNKNDLDGYSNGTYGSDLAQALSSRDIYLSKARNGLEDLDGDHRDDLDNAIESTIRFSMHKLEVDKENGIITEESNPNILTQLGIEDIDHDEER